MLAVLYLCVLLPVFVSNFIITNVNSITVFILTLNYRLNFTYLASINYFPIFVITILLFSS